MKLLRTLTTVAAAAVLAGIPSLAAAQTWTSWTSMTAGAFDGTVLGTSVTFLGGDIGGNLSNAGIDYFAPSGAYTQNGLTAPDAGGNTGFIQFDNPTTGTFTFGSPVQDLYLAFISVGQTHVGVSYTFDRPFTVVSNNNTQCAYWGCGSYTVSGDTFTGNEFSGTIEFAGPVSELSFTTQTPEYWHGVTVGADQLSVTATPEPATIVLTATGFAGILGVARARRKRAAARAA